jgi:ribonuclease HII
LTARARHVILISMRRRHADLSWERRLWSEGLSHVAGVDEVGRGPLAGPVAAGAVVFPPGVRAAGRFRFLKRVNDSKQLTANARDDLSALIWEHALSAAVCFVSVETIDRIGIAEASRQAMLAAIGDLTVVPDHLLVDAVKLPGCRLGQSPIIGGDATCVSIAAGSIIAKVARDRVMQAEDARHPGYGFAHNKGYFTAEHAEAIRDLGPCDLHRRSFSPVKGILLGEQLDLWPREVALT